MNDSSFFKRSHHLASRFSLWPLMVTLTMLMIAPSTHATAKVSIRVGVYNFQPVVFRGLGGQPRGIGISVLKYVADREGWDLEFVEGTWNECLERLEAGRLDIVPGASYTAERAKRYRFNREGFLRSYGAIYMRKDGSIRSIEDLAGKTIAVHVKGAIGKALKELLRDRRMTHRIIEAEDYDGVFKAIEAGQADAGVVNHFYGHLNRGRFLRIAESPILFSPGQVYFMGSMKAPPEMMDAIDRHLRALIADDDSIYHRELKELGIDEWAIIHPRTLVPLWLKTTLIGSLSIAILLIAITTLLKRQIRKKTFELSESNLQLKHQIDERKNAEAALNDIQQRISALMGNLPGIIYRCHNDKYFTFEIVSTGVHQMLGFHPEHMESPRHAKGLRHLVHPQDFHILEQRHSRQEDGPLSYTAVYRIRTGKDRYQYVSDRGIFICDETGQLTAFEGFISEITSTQEAEIRLHRENERLRLYMKERYRFGNIIGKSAPMQRVYELILKAATSDKSVIIQGESGTGKELVARAIHDASSRAGKAFVVVNCGAIPESLIESEFFGYNKGAFTGAEHEKTGLLTAAHGGTLFLDEIGDIPLVTQLKLLRAIEGGGYTPVGGKQALFSDVRIVTATNKDLVRLVESGHMRPDFYYRISILSIKLPPLRERREDIPLLTDHFLENYPPGEAFIPANILEMFKTYSWPGNIRELRNIVWRYLTLKEIPFREQFSFKTPDQLAGDDDHADPGNNLALKDAVEAFEKTYIEKLLSRHDWNRGTVASILKINRRTLFNKIKNYAITPQKQK